MGIFTVVFVLVFAIVLFVTESPIEGKPCDDECMMAPVVFAVLFLSIFKHHIFLTAAQTC